MVEGGPYTVEAHASKRIQCFHFSNFMQPTTFMEDELYITGFAHGGLSEVGLSKF